MSTPPVHRGHLVLIRDLLIFLLKLVLDAFKDVVLIKIAIVAALFDLLFGRRGRPLLFYNTLRLGERFDLWINLYAPAREAENQEDGLFGSSEPGDGSLVGHLEGLARDGLRRAPRPRQG